MALWFGLSHLYGGIPSDVMECVFTGTLGLLFRKAMRIERGRAWPWLLQFLTDAVIFTYFAMAAVVPK